MAILFQAMGKIIDKRWRAAAFLLFDQTKKKVNNHSLLKKKKINLKMTLLLLLLSRIRYAPGMFQDSVTWPISMPLIAAGLETRSTDHRINGSHLSLLHFFPHFCLIICIKFPTFFTWFQSGPCSTPSICGVQLNYLNLILKEKLK